MCEDEDGNIQFSWKEDAQEEEISDDEESEPLELLLHIDGAEDVFDQGEQCVHMQALDETIQHFTPLPCTQPQYDEEGNDFSSSLRLFDMVISSFTKELSGSFSAEKEISIDDLVNFGETTSLVQWHKEEHEHFELHLAPHPLPLPPLCLPEALPKSSNFMEFQGSLSSHTSFIENHIFESHDDPISCVLLGLESSFCGPINELGIHLPLLPNVIAMDIIPSLEFPPLESKDPLSNEVVEGFINMTTMGFDRDSSQEPYILEFSNEHDFDVSLEIPTCNRPFPPFPLLHEYFDSFLPHVPKMFDISFQGEQFLATLRKIKIPILLRSLVRKWLESDAGIARVGGSTLAEERKVQLEQLPPPLKIRDPPFAKVVSI